MVGSFLFFQGSEVFLAGAETVFEIAHLVAQSVDKFRFVGNVNRYQWIFYVIALGIGPEEVELAKSGMNVSLHHGLGDLELLKVGLHEP